MQDTFAQARTRPKGRQAKRQTIGYIVYKDELWWSRYINTVGLIWNFYTYNGW